METNGMVPVRLSSSPNSAYFACFRRIWLRNLSFPDWAGCQRWNNLAPIVRCCCNLKIFGQTIPAHSHPSVAQAKLSPRAGRQIVRTLRQLFLAAAVIGSAFGQNPCLELPTQNSQVACLRAELYHPPRQELNLKEFDDQWDRVAKAVLRLHCPPVEVNRIIEAANNLVLSAAKARGSYTRDAELLAKVDANTNDLIRKVQLLTVKDKAQANALKAIKRLRKQAGL
jgi:hypothetical protein